MKNYFKTNLTVKLFVLVCSLLISISLVICGLFSITMPKSYVELQNKEFEKDIQNMIDSLSSMNIEEAKEVLNLFANKADIYAELYDAQGEFICAYGDKTKANRVIQAKQLSIQSKGILHFQMNLSEISMSMNINFLSLIKIINF